MACIQGERAAYSMRVNSNKVIYAAIQQAAGDSVPISVGRAKFRIEQWVIHTRYCSENFFAPGKYKFNINPNTLSADFELWVCGEPDHYYLIPVSLMSEMYLHPEAYVDSRHPDIRVVSVEAVQNRAIYARGGTSVDLSQYFRARLQ